ncbi:MAG: EF-hand domain-containing protein [Sphingobium sp.]
MKKSLLIAGAAVLAIAVPAIAAHHEGDADGSPKMMMQDMTRADVEAKVKDHFAKVDANKDGAITMEEMDAYREAKQTNRMDAHFARMDANGDGSISREEFASAHDAMREKRGDMREKMKERRDQMAENGEAPGSRPMGMMRGMKGHHGDMGMMGGRMFKKADANGDGKVTMAEATSAALAHFDKVDADKNGTVTPAERMEFWKSMKAEWKAKASRDS